MKFKNKLLFILFLFFFFMLINCKSSFGYYEFNNDNFVVANYNTEWIESYLDLGMNPVDGIKNVLIDKHQDFFSFNSSELGNYWVCEKITKDDNYYYLFLICPGQIAVKAFYETHTVHTYITENLDSSEYKYFSILFAKDGFYSDGNYLLDSWCPVYFPDEFRFYGYEFIVSNYDILDYSSSSAINSGAILFTEPETKNGTTLAPVIQREKTKGTLQIVLMEIVQILPLIIVVVVSFLGLRKALKMLSQLLRRS